MVHLSASAIGEIKRLRIKHLKTELGLLRLSLQPSDCSTFAYHMEFVPNQQPQDQCFTCGEIQVVVASDLLPYLDELTLDYSEDLMGGGFRFQNPNAIQTCGCGNAFAVAQQPAIAEFSGSCI
jgi:iron-sulfur cluster assembly protein